MIGKILMRLDFLTLLTTCLLPSLIEAYEPVRIDLEIEDPCWFHKREDPVLVCTVHSMQFWILWRKDWQYLVHDEQLIGDGLGLSLTTTTQNHSSREQRLRFPYNTTLPIVKQGVGFLCENQGWRSQIFTFTIPDCRECVSCFNISSSVTSSGLKSPVELDVEDPCWYVDDRNPVFVCTAPAVDDTIHWFLDRSPIDVFDSGDDCVCGEDLQYCTCSYPVALNRGTQEKLLLSTQSAKKVFDMNIEVVCQTNIGQRSRALFLGIPGISDFRDCEKCGHNVSTPCRSGKCVNTTFPNSQNESDVVSYLSPENSAAVVNASFGTLLIGVLVIELLVLLYQILGLYLLKIVNDKDIERTAKGKGEERERVELQQGPTPQKTELSGAPDETVQHDKESTGRDGGQERKYPESQQESVDEGTEQLPVRATAEKESAVGSADGIDDAESQQEQKGQKTDESPAAAKPVQPDNGVQIPTKDNRQEESRLGSTEKEQKVPQEAPCKVDQQKPNETNAIDSTNQGNILPLPTSPYEWRQRLDNIKMVLQTLASMNRPVDSDQITAQEQLLRRLLDIPMDKWVQNPVSSKDRYISLSAEIHRLYIDNDKLSPKQVLSNASDGLALNGLLVGETIEPKQKVLSPPENVKFVESFLKEDSLDEESFQDEGGSNVFFNDLQQMGFSVAAEMKMKRDSDVTQKQTVPKSYSIAKHRVFPTAACKLELSDLKLASGPICELQTIKKAILDGESTESIRTRCVGFLNTYGSHVNARVIHFGGSSYSLATCSGGTSPKSVVKDMLGLVVLLNNSGFGLEGDMACAREVAGLVTAPLANDPSNFDNISLHQSYHGGPEKGTSLPVWKLGLLANNGTWALIDRGKSSDFVGIWDLIRSQRELETHKTLASRLREAWQRMNHLDFDDKALDLEQPKPKLPVLLEEGQCSTLLQRLGLTRYYPGGISMHDAISIKQFPEQVEPKELPWKFMQMLIRKNPRCRDQLLSSLEQASDTHSCEIFSDDFEADDEVDDTKEFNPMDVLQATYLCCDGILQQMLVQNLFDCKLAIPLFYPVGSSQSVNMSLWSLRTVVIESQDDDFAVLNKKSHVVSFIRLGRPLLSKSKLVNSVLREEPHNTFFNSECYNSGRKRHIANGLVKCAWFLPAEKGIDKFQKVMLFLNLRGNGPAHGKQLETLKRCSTAVVVAINIEDIEKQEECDALLGVCQKARNVILLLTTRPFTGRNIFKMRREEFSRKIGKETLQKIHTIVTFNLKDGSPMTVGDLTRKVCEKISKVVSSEDSYTISVEEIGHVAEEIGIEIDENGEDCATGKHFALEVFSHMNKTSTGSQKLLPLQGDPWLEYSSLLKKQHKTGSERPFSHESPYDSIEEGMKKQCLHQFKICNDLPPFFQRFLECVSKSNERKHKSYFLHWLKTLLDADSRDILPKLRNEYHEVWTQHQKARQAGNIPEDLQKKLKLAEQNLENASFGLNNLFREIGQFYEAVLENEPTASTDLTRKAKSLPGIAADLLLEGFPLELVDGNTTNIPKVWIKAVLSEINKTLGKVFVVSVVGLQSSGKSTLLNTLMGAKFAVMAGRCTRGAFMQVVPVDQEAGLPMKYIVVVDTEGLRASAVERPKHMYDNQLATLTIGVGDITIINIKGENPAEMEDILGIAVRAFMRMRIVNRQLKMYQSCVFIHQNVSAANAKEKVKQERLKFQERLDKMTVEAAKEDKIVDIHSFSQIIKFDVNKHVWYFSDLWQGNPPMAPSNPGYSHEVGNVLSFLLEMSKGIKNNFLTSNELSVRLQDLWKAVLTDDFVFSFRDNLELRAYNNLEKKYLELQWELHSAIQAWMKEYAEMKLKKCDDRATLEKCFVQVLGDLKTYTTKKKESFKEGLVKYFCSGVPDIVSQWKETRLIAVELDAEQMHMDGKIHLTKTKESLLIDLVQKTEFEKQKMTILDKATELASKLKGGKYTDAFLDSEFEKIWGPLADEFTSRPTGQPTSIDETIHSVLFERFKTHGFILNEELRKCRLTDSDRLSSLYGSFVPDVDTMYFQMKLHFETKEEKEGTASAEKEIRATTGSVLSEIDMHLRNLKSQDISFKRLHAVEVFRILQKHFEDFNESKTHTLTITPAFITKLAVHVGRHCVGVFKAMQDSFDAKNGPAAKLRDYRQTAQNFFLNKVRQTTNEATVADLLCDQLEAPMEHEVSSAIPKYIEGEVMRDFPLKRDLIVGMMKDLANKESFDSYKKYLNNPSSFASEWLTEYTHKKCFSALDESEPLYIQLAKHHIQKIKKGIERSVRQATDTTISRKVGSLKSWTNEFCTSLQLLPVQLRTFYHLNNQEIGDFGRFETMILEKMGLMEEKLIKRFREHDKSVKCKTLTPSETIHMKLWGCSESCPFCGEPCSRTSSRHVMDNQSSHGCIQHRPKGVGGWGWYRTIGKHTKNQLAVESCRYLVSQDLRFFCGSCEICRDPPFRGHFYKEFKKVHPHWDIDPDPTNPVSKYWMWFMSTYKQNLKAMYGAELPDLPRSWLLVTTEEALCELDSLFVDE